MIANSESGLLRYEGLLRNETSILCQHSLECLGFARLIPCIVCKELEMTALRDGGGRRLLAIHNGRLTGTYRKWFHGN